MYKYDLRGGDATALVGGTSIIIMSFVTILQHKLIDSLEKITDYIRDGFTFGIKILSFRS